MPNKTNPHSAYGLQVQQEITNELEKEPQSIAQLSKKLGRPYHTTLQAVRALENDGSIVPANKIYRGTTYKIANGEVISHKIVPSITVNNVDYKVNALLGLREQDSPRASEAVKNIPKHLARILKTAERLSNGDQKAALSLETIKIAMEQDLSSLQNAIEIYRQLLKNGKLWSPELLAKFPNDTEWDQQELNEAYTFYFKD